jgi:Raf kinase inhibitor-like YbhB/YbcL family protein
MKSGRPLLRLACALAAPAALLAASCAGGSSDTATQTPASTTNSTMRLTSDAFPDGGTIPVEYTCTGRNTSPPLRWSGAPEGTHAFALIVDDPDAPAGTFDHWVVYDLPAATTGLAAGASVAGDAHTGKNGRGSAEYTGPCPPPGTPHHYQFKLYALDAALGLAAGKSKADVEKAMQGHILAQAMLVGLYGR